VSVCDLVGEWVGEVVAERMIMCLDFAEVSVSSWGAAGFEGVCDKFKAVAVDMVSVRTWAAQISLDELQRACAVKRRWE
jgi:hypothetical protein